MKLSGIDPGIIRELSGIYKPFIKAFKELVSNAYDADAKQVTVKLSDDWKRLSVIDDGIGMTPFDFHKDFARIGGSTAWQHDGKSPGGRARIGYKGIGFLAVARYCKALSVNTHARRSFRGRFSLPVGRHRLLHFDEMLGNVIPYGLIKDRIQIKAVTIRPARGPDRKLTPKKQYAVTPGQLWLDKWSKTNAAFDVDYEIDCRHLQLTATLDFEYLLGLERKADLRVLDDFCTITAKKVAESNPSFTHVELIDLKDFVIRDLAAPAAKGKARNIGFRSGKEQFLWKLARASPIRDEIPPNVGNKVVADYAKAQTNTDLPDVIVRWRKEDPIPLRRAVYLAAGRPTPLSETVFPVDINEGGLRVTGYLLARSEVIYPAELRGIAVRVRNVAIGDPSYLGWEHIMSGPRKAAMSQISGELSVRQGLDAADAINPGRESFYEESRHYQILKRTLFGSDETVGGLVGKAIRSILDRIQVRSQVTDRLAEARQRRKSLTDIASAVSFYGRGEPATAAALTEFFQKSVAADGLASAKDVTTRPGRSLAGFDIEEDKGLTDEFQIDFARKKVRFDFSHEAWSTSVYLHGHYYDVQLKQGKPEHPICEFDNEQRRIYVNWGHPVKQQMNDAAFIKSAILLRLALHAAPGDANKMMDLALNMMAFRAE
jgi:hypothetical protein